MVISGINLGANMGDDTIYSGTVAAAMEGFQLGVPAIAFSLAQKGYAHLDVAARVAVGARAHHVVDQLQHERRRQRAEQAERVVAAVGDQLGKQRRLVRDVGRRVVDARRGHAQSLAHQRD